MSNLNPTILPSNQSDFVKALDIATADELSTIDADIVRKLSDPWDCPAEFLQWLAFAVSVDVWNENWAESVKRQVVANSMSVHKIKGTLGSIRDALDALGVRFESVQWWEKSPAGERGTASVKLWIAQNILPGASVVLGDELIADVKKAIDRNKRFSIHYDLSIGFVSSAKVSMVGAASVNSVSRGDVEAVTSQGESSAGLGLSMFINPTTIIRGYAS